MRTLGWTEALKSARIAAIEYYAEHYHDASAADVKPIELRSCAGHYDEARLKDEWAAFLVPLEEATTYVLLTRATGGEWEILSEWR